MSSSTSSTSIVFTYCAKTGLVVDTNTFCPFIGKERCSCCYYPTHRHLAEIPRSITNLKFGHYLKD